MGLRQRTADGDTSSPMSSGGEFAIDVGSEGDLRLDRWLSERPSDSRTCQVRRCSDYLCAGAGSSTRQSSGLLTRRLWVQFPPGPPGEPFCVRGSSEGRRSCWASHPTRSIPTAAPTDQSYASDDGNGPVENPRRTASHETLGGKRHPQSLEHPDRTS